MRGDSPSHTEKHGRTRSLVALGTLAIGATVCTGAIAAVGGDDGLLPPGSADAGASLVRSEPERAERPRPSPTGPSDRLTWPLHGAITGRFGEGRSGHTHEGIDIPMPPGTPIRAASSGVVVMRELQDGYGKYTCVAHRRITTCYGHQSRFHTKLGARIRRGQVIGYVGNTGNSPATHLHFEVRRGTKPWGRAMNPVKYLPRNR